MIFVTLEEETEDSKPKKGPSITVENMQSPVISAKMFGVYLVERLCCANSKIALLPQSELP